MPKPKAIDIEDKDVPLRDDIRLLGRILGDTVGELSGETVFGTVEGRSARSKVPSSGRWIRPGPMSSQQGFATAILDWPTGSSSDPIRWRPRADPRQKRDTVDRSCSKGSTDKGP